MVIATARPAVMVRLCPDCAAQVLNGQNTATVDITRVAGSTGITALNSEVPVLIRRSKVARGRSSQNGTATISPPKATAAQPAAK